MKWERLLVAVRFGFSWNGNVLDISLTEQINSLEIDSGVVLSEDSHTLEGPATLYRSGSMSGEVRLGPNPGSIPCRASWCLLLHWDSVGSRIELHKDLYNLIIPVFHSLTLSNFYSKTIFFMNIILLLVVTTSIIVKIKKIFQYSGPS